MMYYNYNTDAVYFSRIFISLNLEIIADIYLCGNNDYATTIKSVFESETLTNVNVSKGKIVVAEKEGVSSLYQTIESAELKVKVAKE